MWFHVTLDGCVNVKRAAKFKARHFLLHEVAIKSLSAWFIILSRLWPGRRCYLACQSDTKTNLWTHKLMSNWSRITRQRQIRMKYAINAGWGLPKHGWFVNWTGTLSRGYLKLAKVWNMSVFERTTHRELSLRRTVTMHALIVFYEWPKNSEGVLFGIWTHNFDSWHYSCPCFAKILQNVHNPQASKFEREVECDF